MWIIPVILGVLIIAFVLFVQRSGGFNFPFLQFYVRGKESGFRFHELNLLRRVAVDNKLRDPTSLFWSEKTLDRCIRGTIVKFRSQGKEEDEASIAFLDKLYDFRKRVEFSLPKYRLGLRSTRSIATRQPLKITFPGGGIYYSQVVENMRRYLAISHPKGKALPVGFTWKGQRVSVYFWRAEDAGYYFETSVVGDYLERKYPILHVAHADDLVRTQKRRSVRATLEQEGRLYQLSSIQNANEDVERVGGYKCRMVDLSEDGAAVMVGGKGKPGLPVKIQTVVNDQTVVLCGTVKGVTFKQKKNISILHLEAVSPSKRMRSIILTFVYGIFREGKKGAIRSVK